MCTRLDRKLYNVIRDVNESTGRRRETCESTFAHWVDLDVDSCVFGHSSSTILGLNLETVEVFLVGVQWLRITHVTYI